MMVIKTGDQTREKLQALLQELEEFCCQLQQCKIDILIIAIWISIKVGSKIIRALEIIRVKKFIPNTVS